MIITISGKPGSGKSTVADILAKKLKLKRYSVGNYRREMAKRLGLDLEELNKLGENKDFTDKEADNWQEELGKKENNFIIDGRLSYHFIPDSIKIFIDVKPEVGARRIRLDNRKEEKSKTDKEALKLWKERYKSDLKRYKKYYNLNPYDKKQYDFILDTSNLSIGKMADKILEFISKSRKWKNKN